MAEENYPYTETEKLVYRCGYQFLWAVKWQAPILHAEEGRLAHRLHERLHAHAEGQPWRIGAQQYFAQFLVLDVHTEPDQAPYEVLSTLKYYTSSVLRREFPYVTNRIPSVWSKGSMITTLGAPFTDEQIEAFLRTQPAQRQEPLGFREALTRVSHGDLGFEVSFRRG